MRGVEGATEEQTCFKQTSVGRLGPEVPAHQMKLIILLLVACFLSFVAADDVWNSESYPNVCAKVFALFAP